MIKTRYRVWDVKRRKMFPVKAIFFNKKGNADRVETFEKINSKYSTEDFSSENVILMENSTRKDTIGRSVFENDVVISDEYPFFSDGKMNYVGVVVKDENEFYVEMVKVSNRVRGIANGTNLDDYIEEPNFRVISNKFEFNFNNNY